MKTSLTILAALLAAAVAMPAWAQELPKADPNEPAPSPTVEDKSKDTVQDDLGKLLDGMTPEQIQELIKKSAQMRLTGERKQVAAEIVANLTIAQNRKDAAVKILEDNPANTQKDNIDRISRAFCQIDDRFAAACKLHKGGKFAEAAEAFKKITSTQDVNYFAAARGYLLGDALYRAGLAGLDTADASKEMAARKVVWEGVDVWLEMLENMPDRVSFSSSAALARAEALEKLGRGIYAMDMYTFVVKNFALTLDKEQVDAISDKLAKLTEVYKDPMQYVSKGMGEVMDLLAKSNSGKPTQDKQQEVASVLLDMIKTLEEKQQQQSKSPPPQRGEKPGDKKGEGEGKGQGQGQPKQGKGSRPQDTKPPSSPAQVSALPDGPGSRKVRGTEFRDGEPGDWSTLPPRTRDALNEAQKKVLSERYRDMIRDYHTRLAEDR